MDALFSAVLYIATYVSFMNLLKYPRNWYHPSVSSIVVTGILSIATIFFVSASTNDFNYKIDLGAALYLFGFMILLFGIIASPAIDFNPGSRPIVEFWANRGDYAGVWMLLPAIAGSYVFPSTKLHAVLAVAIAIELSWYLRNKLNRKRKLYSLSDHDLLVLNSQAKGDIEGFAKQHGIWELNFLPKDTQWNGCSKSTLPCAINLYTNRLGLNTPPCCREHMKDLTYFVSSCLKEMGAVHWLEGGSLLGAVRENGNLLAWEDDVDISFLTDDKLTWSTVAQGISDRGKRGGYYVDVFEGMEFISVSYDRPLPWPLRWERNRMRGEIRLDLVAYRHAVSHGQPILERRTHKGAMPVTESGWYGVPETSVLPTSTIRFLGGDIPCPKQSQSYLRNLYGEFQTIEFTYLSSEAAKTRPSADTG